MIENISTNQLWQQRHAIVATQKVLPDLQTKINQMAETGILVDADALNSLDDAMSTKLAEISRELYDRYLLSRRYLDPIRARIRDIQVALNAHQGEVDKINQVLASKRQTLIDMGSDPAKTLELFPDVGLAEWSAKQIGEKRAALADQGVSPDRARDLIPDVDVEAQQQTVSSLSAELEVLDKFISEDLWQSLPSAAENLTPVALPDTVVDDLRKRLDVAA